MIELDNNPNNFRDNLSLKCKKIEIWLIELRV